ncbi:MAG: hypothetical protein C4523_20610 [Myxococcales bacterium]|nr:MAG: hypothetical protein C4523_20610 [Myxococcales bacterium]
MKKYLTFLTVLILMGGLGAFALFVLAGEGWTDETREFAPYKAGAADKPAPAKPGDVKQSPEAKYPMLPSKTAEECPMIVPGVQVKAAETAKGVALEFTTDKKEKVKDLRKLVKEAAIIHEKNEQMTTAKATKKAEKDRSWFDFGGSKAEAENQAKTEAKTETKAKTEGKEACKEGDFLGESLPPADVIYEEINNGGRVVLTPEEKDDLKRLRENVKEHVRNLNPGECPQRAC